MSADSCEEVLQTELLLGEVLKRSRGSKAFLRASFVSKFWRDTGCIESVVSGFTRRNSACFIGFMFEHNRGYGPEMKLITPPGTTADDPAWLMRERFLPDCLFGKYVLGTYGGRVISYIMTAKRQGRLYMNCPYSTPWAFKSVGCPIPRMPENPSDSRYGQLVVLPRSNGPYSGFPVFFVKDPSRLFEQGHHGVKFRPAGRVRVHVCVFNNGGWVPHVFGPLALPSSGTFQRTPYCVQSGSRLYLMYLVGLIVCFDVERGTFGVVDLPGQMGTIVECCLEYTAGPHPRGDLAVVHLDNGMLVRWVLTRKGDMAEWNQEASVDVVAAFGHLMNTAILDALSAQPSDWVAIQVRSVSPDGRYLLISVGVIYGLFVVDMFENKVKVVPNLGKMGRVFTLSENWPPKL